ncbi:hypothetical protein Cgig2_006120 [Carnegiea gigantea]|uniref:Peptidyl-prolyl cis-trans isomerase n=1 Tax=Carnegiea gigantea TaxID=171969 RepID=A0A9Q1KYM9_9CARY|nr:hypothetical protein Cgig2_006120 [Carnegiea gigantea]
MGKDSKKKEPAGKGKGKQTAGGGTDEGASKDKGGGKGDKLSTCTFVKARHILCEKQGKINEVYQKLREGWLDSGDKVPPAEFGKVCLGVDWAGIELLLAKMETYVARSHFRRVSLGMSCGLAAQYSECPSGKKGGDLGWFPRGKMAGPFQEVAFATAVGATSAPFKSTHGYHIILCEGRRG